MAVCLMCANVVEEGTIGYDTVITFVSCVNGTARTILEPGTFNNFYKEVDRSLYNALHVLSQTDNEMRNC